jgi:multidrug efflux pump subunit AcrB
VRPRDGGAVLVLDVADVVVGSATLRGDASVSGSPGVVLGIQKQPGVNTLELSQRIEAVLATSGRRCRRV